MCPNAGRDKDILARACDLGVAMQLTNIVRDIGEDARSNRIYIPTDWLKEKNIDLKIFSEALNLQRVSFNSKTFIRRSKSIV